LARGQASGELPAERDRRRLARWLVITLHGLAMAARIGRTRRELEEVVDEVVAVLRGPLAAPLEPRHATK
jgi:hypothetical protein